MNGKRLSQNGRSKVEHSDLIEVPGYEIRINTAQERLRSKLRRLFAGRSPATSRSGVLFRLFDLAG